MKMIALLCLLCTSAFGQSSTTGKAETKGACSLANTGNKNTFNIKCGIDKEQGDQIIKLLNQMLAKHIDPGAVMTILENIESQVKTTGMLEPDTRPDLALSFPRRPSTPSDLNVLLGPSLVVVQSEKCTIVELAGKAVLWIERAEKGLLISAKVFGPDSRIVASVEKNEVTVNPNNTFKRKIAPHKLIVVDQRDQEVLNVDFVNPRWVIITGIFYQSGYGWLAIDHDSMRDSRRNKITGGGAVCGGGAAYAF